MNSPSSRKPSCRRGYPGSRSTSRTHGRSRFGAVLACRSHRSEPDDGWLLWFVGVRPSGLTPWRNATTLASSRGERHLMVSDPEGDARTDRSDPSPRPFQVIIAAAMRGVWPLSRPAAATNLGSLSECRFPGRRGVYFCGRRPAGREVASKFSSLPDPSAARRIDFSVWEIAMVFKAPERRHVQLQNSNGVRMTPHQPDATATSPPAAARRGSPRRCRRF